MLWENRYHRHPHRRCYYCPSLDGRGWHRRQRLAATEQMAKMNSRIPPSFFCNASIPERFSESYYQHHQGMIDKRSESNISTNETKKAAVRSHIGSRTAACLLILYSFLSLGVRTTPDHKSGRAHLQNVASRWAKLKF